MEQTIYKDGRNLRLGYTTGSCAAAAAKAAAWMLLTGAEKTAIALDTPRGIRLEMKVEQTQRTPGAVSCGIRKDAGDDPDVTDGALICATVSYSGTPGVTIDGGPGIGRVTKPGLDQRVGSAAINSVPRRMIRENVEQVLAAAGEDRGLDVLIWAPEGEALAKKTFNPRLGIVGGISILGTSGIVEPMSERALLDTIRLELRQRRETGADYVLLTPGNYGADFVYERLGICRELPVQVSNFIGDGLDFCRELGFRGALLIGHIGKLVKLGGGMLNTHSKYGDCRMEILAAMAGAAGTPPEAIAQILECAACDEAVRILKEYGTLDASMARLTDRVDFHLRNRAGDGLEVGAVLFSKQYGILGQTENARNLLKRITEG